MWVDFAPPLPQRKARQQRQPTEPSTWITQTTTTKPWAEKRWVKSPPNCSRPQNRAENRAPPWTPVELQTFAFQRLVTQNFAKCRPKTFLSHIYFKLVHTQNPCTRTPQKKIFLWGQHSVKPGSRSTSDRPDQLFYKTDLLLHDVTNLWRLCFFSRKTWLKPNKYIYIHIHTCTNICKQASKCHIAFSKVLGPDFLSFWA